MERQTYVLTGTIKAESPLAVSRHGDNFKFGGQSEKLQRLPRSGPKHPDTEVYFPASTLNGAIRRAGLAVIRRAVSAQTGNATPFNLDTHYMLTQGVDTAKAVKKDNAQTGLIEEESDLRAANPFLSLFGRWGLAGHLGMGDAFPTPSESKEAITYVTGTGARTNDWVRSPETIQFIAAGERERLKQILVQDAAVAKDIKALKEDVKNLKASLRATKSDLDAQRRIKAEILEIEEQIKKGKEGKVGAEESIQRTLDGYECIKAGVELQQKIVLTQVSKDELGLFILALAEFSREPRVGSHIRQGAGLISARWEVNTRPIGSWRQSCIGVIELSFEEFSITDMDEASTLSSAASSFEERLSNCDASGFNFSRATKLVS